MSHLDVFLFLIAVVVRYECLGKPLQRHSRNHYIENRVGSSIYDISNSTADS